MYIFASTNPSQVQDTNTSLRQLQRQVRMIVHTQRAKEPRLLWQERQNAGD